jgi:Uridine phosphorylase
MTDQLRPEVGSSHSAAPYTEADLPIDAGRIYHLQVKPEQVAPDILLVGDPGRAEFIGSTLLRDLELEHEHRGLVTITGTSQITGNRATIISPLKTTVTTSGMGTPSLEIVLSELVALHEIDFATRTRKTDFPRMHVIRVGTSGALQASTPLGTPIVTSYAIGMDNTGLFYEAPVRTNTAGGLNGNWQTGQRFDEQRLPLSWQDPPLCRPRRTGHGRGLAGGRSSPRSAGQARFDGLQQRLLRPTGPGRVTAQAQRPGTRPRLCRI